MKVISFVNPKGGVGKTTTAFNVAAALAEEGNRVLVMDLDPHGGLSKKFGLNPEALDRSLFQYLCDPNGNHPFKDFILGTEIPNIDIIPGHRDLEALDQVLTSQQDIYPFIFVRDNVALATCRQSYTYVIIDTQPRYSPLVISALNASDLCVVPFIPETDTSEAFAGVQDMFDTDVVKEGGLKYRVLFTMVQEATVHHSIMMKAIRDSAKDLVFNTIIKRSIAVSEAHSTHKPIVLKNKKHPAAESYRRFTKELIKHA